MAEHDNDAPERNQQLEIEPRPRQVRRYNALPVFIALAAVVLVLAALGLLATRRPAAPQPEPDRDQPAGYSAQEELERMARRPEPPPAPTVFTPPPPVQQPARQQAPAGARPVLVSEFTNLPGGARRQAGAAAPGGADGTAATGWEREFQRRREEGMLDDAEAAQAQARIGAAGFGAPPVDGRPEELDVRRNRYRSEFVESAESLAGSSPRFAARRPAASPFSLRAGTFLPALLQTEINSDLPGHAQAIVRRDVYDSIAGQHLLIPRGSVLYGEYDSRVVWGERRVLIAFNRIIFPDGSSTDIPGSPGVDGLGASGLGDQVNNHFVRLFGSAFVLGLITAGYQISQEDDTIEFNQDAADVAAAAVAQEMSRASAAVLQRNLGIAPTLRVRPGFVFGVEIVRDLVFNDSYHPLAPQQPGLSR